MTCYFIVSGGLELAAWRWHCDEKMGWNSDMTRGWVSLSDPQLIAHKCELWVGGQPFMTSTRILGFSTLLLQNLTFLSMFSQTFSYWFPTHRSFLRESITHEYDIKSAVLVNSQTIEILKNTKLLFSRHYNQNHVTIKTLNLSTFVPLTMTPYMIDTFVIPAEVGGA